MWFLIGLVLVMVYSISESGSKLSHGFFQAHRPDADFSDGTNAIGIGLVAVLDAFYRRTPQFSKTVVVGEQGKAPSSRYIEGFINFYGVHGHQLTLFVV